MRYPLHSWIYFPPPIIGEPYVSNFCIKRCKNCGITIYPSDVDHPEKLCSFIKKECNYEHRWNIESHVDVDNLLECKKCRLLITEENLIIFNREYKFPCKYSDEEYVIKEIVE